MYYNTGIAARFRWATGAAGHGFGQDDVIHAMSAGLVGYEAEFEASQVPGQGAPWLFIGRTQAGVLIEVLGYREGEAFVVFHVMQARDKMVAVLGRGQK